MSAFETKIESSSEGDSGSRSRSDRDQRVNASSVHVAITSPSGSTFSSPEVQRAGVLPSGTAIATIAEQPNVVLPLGTNSNAAQLALGNGSPDATLSQFLQDSPNEVVQHIPTNPFDSTPQPRSSSTGPVESPGLGNIYMANQSNVRNELHVSLDPLLVAHAHQAVEQSRVDILSQAQVALDQSRAQMRDEASQAVSAAQGAAKAEAIHMISQAQSSAARTVEETQREATGFVQRAANEVDLIRSQATTEIARLKGEAQQTVASEVDLIRSQATTEIARVKGEAQQTVALLEGRIQELRQQLSQMDSKATKMVEERDKMIHHLVDRIQEQDAKVRELNATVARMQGNAMRQPFESGNGAEVRIHTPEGLPSSSQGHMFSQQPIELSLPAQDSKSQKLGEMPLGSVGRTAKDDSVGKLMAQVGKKSSQPVEDVISDMKSMLAQIEKQVSRSPSAKHPSDKGSPSSSSSSQKPGGGGSPGGSDQESRSSVAASGSTSSVKSPYDVEKKLMRIKGYDNLKIASIPKNAAECRGFKNQVISAICKLCKGDEAPLVEWIQRCAIAKSANEFQNVGNYPLLDRTLGHKLLENARGSKFSLDFQALQERCQKVGKQPSGRALLWFILNKYSLDKDRGASLSQHHLLSLKLHGKDVKSLEDFRQKMLYIMGSLEQTEMPQESALRSMLYENVKHHPLMALAIDKFRSAREGSSKRTSAWLMEKIDETIELAQQDENTTFVEKALKTTGGTKETPAGPSKPDTKKEGKEASKEKPSKESKTKKESKAEKPDKKGDQGGTSSKDAVNAAPGASKGGGKGGKKGNGGAPKTEPPKKTSKDEKGKQPCMYFAFDSCTKGDKCPYLHDKNNLYKGEKPKALTKSTPAGSATVQAGAARVVTGVVASSSIVGSGASSLQAPYHASSEDLCEGSFFGSCRKMWRKLSGRSKVAKVKVKCKSAKKDVRQKGFPSPMLFEKTMKCFAAIAAVCNPQGFQQEFLVDSGAGRNLISSKDMPVQWNEFVADAPEQLRFATGGGMRPSSKAVKLKGEISGEGIFYTLKDCPAAISLGQQVNEQGKAWIWFPNQLPYFIQSHRISDVTFHCPESAKLYVDRVEQNVPILSETVECLAMPAKDEVLPKPSAAGSSSSSSGEKPSPAPPELPSTDLVVPSEEGSRSRNVESHELVETSGVRDVSPSPSVRDEGGPPEDPHSSEDDGEEAAKTFNHQLTHFPKSKHCEICMRAKMTARHHRKRPEPDPDEKPPLHFGHRLRVDHIIIGSEVSKGSEGEQACLICHDEYSGVYQAFSQTSRVTANNVACLRKFGGSKAHGRALCSVVSDSAQELIEAVKQLDWLPEPGLPNDPFHNSKLESNIRRIKEGTRAIHLAAGFPHELWPRSVEYYCIAKSFTTLAPIHPNEPDDVKRWKQGLTCYEVANGGEPFEGKRVPLGALVYYKPANHTNKPAFEARTLPGIFAGWRIDSAFKHRKVHLVLDYESVRTNAKGFGRPLQVHDAELVVPENLMFPLFQAEQAKLGGGSGVLPKIALPFEEGVPAPETPARSRKTYITLDRAIRFGKTVGCKGCDRIAEGVRHSDACHERFRICFEEESRKATEEAEKVRRDFEERRERVEAVQDVGMRELDDIAAEFEAAEPSEDPEVPFGAANPSCKHDHPHNQSQVPTNDYWEFDDGKKAWCKIHVRPRKKLFAPVGGDCPFSAEQITHERLTEWVCRRRTSVYKDNWQSNPNQRISSRSWVGKTWFFPTEPIDAKRATIQAAVLNTKVNRGLLKGEAVVENLLEGLDGNSRKSIMAMISKVEPNNHSHARKTVKKGKSVMFEFCCSENSTLGKIHEERGITHFRLSETTSDMSDPGEIESLKKLVSLFPGCKLWGSLPCGPWSKWQSVNLSRLGIRFRKKLEEKRVQSRKLLKHFIEVAEVVLSQGGHIGFEWPKGAAGWQLPELAAFITKNGLYLAECHGCYFGLCSSKGNPMLKPWRVITSDYRLARNLNECRCQHAKDFKHDHVKGSDTPKTAFYPEPMARTISECLFPEHVFAMPVTAKPQLKEKNPRVQGGVKLPALPAKASKHEPNCPDMMTVFAGIHLLLDRKDWNKHDGWREAIDKELHGILENGTWNYKEVVAKDELLSRKEPMHIGRLMTILSVKHWETPELRKLKARIVFRGDDIRDQDNNLAVLQEAKVNPTGLAGINANLAYGCFPNHSTSQSDVVRAYIQSVLNTRVPTWVELPAELVPEEFKNVRRPCVRLYRSLYGHPEAGYHWDQRFKKIMKEMGATHCADTFQSTYFFKDSGLNPHTLR